MNTELVALTGDHDITEKLEAYFRTVDAWSEGRDELGLLPRPEAIEQTENFRSFHPLVRTLQGIVLDDPDTSNHHVVVCRSPLEGTVVYLAHDGDSRIVFDGITSFMEAARRASDAGGFLDDEHPQHAWIAGDQAGLKSLIAQLCSEADNEDIVPVLVPSLDLSDPDYLSILFGGDDVYVAEALCRTIAQRPMPHLMQVAEQGEQHPHPMVRNAATLARKRISGL